LHGSSLATLLRQGDDTVLEDGVVIEWNGSDHDFRADLATEPIPDWMAKAGKKEAIERALADPVRTIVSADGWKFSYSPLGEHELYNLDVDPGETTNLACARRHVPLMRKLASRIVDWQQCTGDKVAVLPDQIE
jgi:hypothetical protein